MYETRNINFKELISIDDWRIKTYTISTKKEFGALAAYKKSVESLPEWLNMTNSFEPNHDNIAFLILHEAEERVFAVINTWVGANILQNHIFISEFDKPEEFKKVSGDGLSSCIWELEIINHERHSWVNNILKKTNEPDFEAYLNDTIDTVYY